MRLLLRNSTIPLLLGALMTLAIAPFFLWPLAIASLAYLYYTITHAPTPKQAILTALLWGLGHHLTALYWLPRAFYVDADHSLLAGALGGIPALIGLSLYGSLTLAAVAYSTHKTPTTFRAPTFILLWVGVEVLKSLHPMGFPWLPVGAAWADSLPLMQAASVGGVHGLSALLLTTAVIISNPTPNSLRTAAALLLTLYAAGTTRLTLNPPTTSPEAPTLRLVQPNITDNHHWNQNLRLLTVAKTMDTAMESPLPTSTTTVILPENAVPFPLDEDHQTRQWLSGHLTGSQTLVTGTFRQNTSTNPVQFFNGITAIQPNATLSGWYDKQLLVPFGEYIPWRSLLDILPLPQFLRILTFTRLDYVPGTTSPLLSTPAGMGLALICYEGIFPYHVAMHSQQTDYLLNITNDNWFLGTTALAQHATLERLRAVETGLPLVRVGNTGITMVVDAFGRIIAQLPVNTPASVDVQLPPKSLPTIWAHILHNLASE